MNTISIPLKWVTLMRMNWYVMVDFEIQNLEKSLSKNIQKKRNLKKVVAYATDSIKMLDKGSKRGSIFSSFNKFKNK